MLAEYNTPPSLSREGKTAQKTETKNNKQIEVVCEAEGHQVCIPLVD